MTKARRKEKRRLLKAELVKHLLNNDSVYQYDLAQWLYVEERDIRSLVHELRQEGHPIASGNFGYRYVKAKTELQRTINRLKCQNRTIVETIFNLEKSGKRGEP